MEFILFLFISLVSLISGVALTLVVQWYLFNSYIMKQPFVGPPKKPTFDSFSLPKGLLEDKTPGRESAGALNAVLQFLFQECRNTKRVRAWFRHRLSVELEELNTRTTTGKLFDRILLRDLNLGSHFPAIRSIEVRNLSVDPNTNLIDDVELCLDLEYSGGFHLSIDASMRLAKTAHVSVKVNELIGQAMLKFTRHPYTHWCFSFYSDPSLQLSVESQFQGRALAQINSIIASQIRKALKRKHTLPHYKIRYKPFFLRNDLEVLEAGEPPAGSLEVTIIEVARLIDAQGPIFCSAAVDKLAWIEMVQSETTGYLTVDVNINKQPGQLIPVIFKQEFIPDKYQVGVVVESITSGGSELKPGDIVVMVEEKPITSLNILNKIMKCNQSCLRFKVERKLKSTTIADENKVSETSGLRHRNSCASTDNNKSDSDSSNPPSSSESPVKRSLKGSPEHGSKGSQNSLANDLESDSGRPQVFTTKDVQYSKVISFDETFKFQTLPEHRYLNLSVWSHGPEKNVLLGHISLPLATHCIPKTVGHCVSTFAFFPPNPNLANSSSHPLTSHSGFEPCLCYGDILLSFSFKSSSNTSSTLPPVTITTTPDTPNAPTPIPPSGEHDFIRTHFDRVTQCGFCFKKIWLKDALLCQGCMMSCHKKCAPKCQTSSSCARSFPRNSQPEIQLSATMPEDNSQSGRSLSTLLASVTQRGLKRVGSATNLAPPGMDGTTSGSISLPPSPNHSPSPSRKASLVEGSLFSSADTGSNEVNQALEVLLSRPCDEHVMDAAKASGKLLFADLPPEARKTRIDNVMSKLKEAINSESLNQQNLLREEQVSENSATKAKLAFLVGKSEEKLQALTVLMLHCCAGLQDYQEALN